MRRVKTRAFLSLKRPVPPSKMPKEARALWCKIVYSYPPRYFEGAPEDHLEQYCVYVALERRAWAVAMAGHRTRRAAELTERNALRMTRMVGKMALVLGFAEDRDHDR